MPLLMQHTATDVRWGIWKTDETVDELLAMFPDAETYRLQLEAFAAEHRRLEWLAVRVLLYTLLGREVRIDYEASGRPCLADGSASISISHTRGYVAVMLAPAGRMPGIDIEQYGERVHRVVSRFMRADERPFTYAGTQTWSLLLHWSAKESMFKAMDVASVDFCRHLRIIPFTVQPVGSFEACEYRTGQQRHFHIHYLLHPDFVFTWLVDGSVSPDGR